MILSQLHAPFQDGLGFLPPKGHVTIHQKSLFLIWISATLLWLYRKATKQISWRKGPAEESVPSREIMSDKPMVIRIVLQSDSTKTTTPGQSRISLNDALSAICITGWIMIYHFICDYMHYFPKSDRTYNRDLFLFLCIMLFVVAAYFTTKETSEEKLLNRDQTEEWKGWMQVLFVWYHYFHAAETYNAVRIYIAAYVWMTGFGNFSFFWVRKDYSIRRMVKVLFRLNFLVIITALVVDNSYMLYYICAMHTFWYFTVYAMMRPFNELNENPRVMFTKFLLYFIVIGILYDVPGVATTVFAPFSFLLNYEGSLHEWIFRSKLDHYATFVGMICAYYHPTMETYLKHVNSHRCKTLIIASVSVILLCTSFLWHNEVFVLTKYKYNALHQYTSWIPILTYIFFRNCTCWLRRRYIALFTFLGKITLEMYISQSHIYQQANGKAIIVYFPGYPLFNLIVNTVIYLYMARLLFNATVTLNEFIFPAGTGEIVVNILVIFGMVGLSYLINVAVQLCYEY